jgi:hypothetical protein
MNAHNIEGGVAKTDGAKAHEADLVCAGVPWRSLPE